MEIHRMRMILITSICLVSIVLFGEWQSYSSRMLESNATIQTKPAEEFPIESIGEREKATPSVLPQSAVKTTNYYTETNNIKIETDTLKLTLSAVGGDVIRAELKQYPESLDDSEKGVLILENVEPNFMVAQTGVIGKGAIGPDTATGKRATYRSAANAYKLSESQSTLEVPLYWEQNGLKISKIYRFERGSYVIAVEHRIENNTPSEWQGHLFAQIKKSWVKTKQNNMLGAQMYQGAAVYTKDKPYKKLSFSDIKDKNFSQQIKGGWVAFLERYFLCAWVPSADLQNHYYTQYEGTDLYKIGTISELNIPSGASVSSVGKWYVGPEIMDNLEPLADGLELTIDYGILWPISKLLFWLLKNIQKFTGNWGWSIILLTVLIKLAFYKLSATSYRSMGKMRKLQPKIEALKARFENDKQAFSQAMLELYRKEKVNPLGGCLPILVQIPVFIALYYVLLESVELRQAPFIFWLKDLSVKDPFYVLPIIMVLSMLLQQRMNPAPPDPIQAKVMMFMPFVFTLLFLSFPAGLVLYWVANNLLSITQQWFIMRAIEKGR